MAKGDKAAAAAPKTHNLDDDQLRDLHTGHLQKYQVILAKKKAIDADMRNLGKFIKADLGPFGLDMIKLSIKISEGTTEATNEEKDKVIQTLRVMRWEGIPVGIQTDLFTPFDERPIEERAFEAGRAAGATNGAMKPPVEMVGTQGPAFEEWCRGWHLSQDKLFEGIKPTGTKAAADKAAAAKTH